MKMNSYIKTERVYGIQNVISAIEDGKTIDKLFIKKGLHNDEFSKLWKLVRLRRINYKHVPIEKLNRLTKRKHEGVFAFISPIDFHKIEDIIPAIFEEGKSPLILVLDSITDVRNFGAITRTAECAGVDAILIPEKNTSAINADAMTTSAGALKKMQICRTWNLKLSLDFLIKSGLQVIGCTQKATNSIYSANFKLPTAIIVGSEEKGINDELLFMCNSKLQIPMYGETESLNVSVAAAIICYEAVRQRI